MEEIKQEKNIGTWLSGVIAGVGAGAIFWWAFLKIGHKIAVVLGLLFLDEVIILSSYLFSIIMAGWISYKITKNSKVSFVTVVLTLLTDLFMTVGMISPFV